MRLLLSQRLQTPSPATPSWRKSCVSFVACSVAFDSRFLSQTHLSTPFSLRVVFLDLLTELPDVSNKTRVGEEYCWQICTFVSCSSTFRENALRGLQGSNSALFGEGWTVWHGFERGPRKGTPAFVFFHRSPCFWFLWSWYEWSFRKWEGPKSFSNLSSPLKICSGKSYSQTAQIITFQRK